MARIVEIRSTLSTEELYSHGTLCQFHCKEKELPRASYIGGTFKTKAWGTDRITLEIGGLKFDVYACPKHSRQLQDLINKKGRVQHKTCFL